MSYEGRRIPILKELNVFGVSSEYIDFYIRPYFLDTDINKNLYSSIARPKKVNILPCPDIWEKLSDTDC